jgi:hypothetical protein
MLNRTMIGTAIALTLNAPAQGGEVVVTGAGKAVEGTVITTDLQNMATQAIEAAWNANKQVVSTSQLILKLAQLAVKEAKGDFKLALNKFDGACADAAAAFRTQHAKAKGAEKAEIDAFLSDEGSWSAYQKSLRGALRDEIDITQYKTESSLRNARKSMKEAARTRSQLKDKLADKLDLSDLTDEEYAEACRSATGESGKLDETKVESELRKLGYVEPETDETDEERDDRIYNEAKTAAGEWLGDDARWQGPRESLAKLLVLLYSIPDDAGHESDVNQALNNTYVKIARIYKPEQSQTQSGEKGTERRIADL